MRYSGNVIRRGMLVAWLCWCIPAPGFAELEEIHKCDEVAAHVSDKQKWGKGVTDEEIAPPLAIKYCSEAVKQYPDSARFHFQLGRAFWVAQKFNEAIPHLSAALEKGHVAAAAYLGDAYRTGQGGVPVDPARATELYQVAAKGGFDAARQTLQAHQQTVQKTTFRQDGFARTDIIVPLYKGDLSGLHQLDRWGKYQVGIYLKAFNDFFKTENFSFIQQELGQNPMACRQLFDPQVEKLIINSAMVTNNPFGDTVQEQAMNSLKNFLDIYKDMAKRGTAPIAERSTNIQVWQEQGGKDAFHVVAEYGCESPVTRQIYQNIPQFLTGGQGVVLVSNKRLANNLTEGCVGAGNGERFCNCMLNSVLKSDIAEEDQELLAASFTQGRLERMRLKYPSFTQNLGVCR